MSFITLQFVALFITVVPLYFVLPLERRWLLLLIASYIFYAGSEIFYLPLILTSTLIDFYAAQAIERTPAEQTARRRFYLSLSIFTNLGMLFFFKYLGFFTNTATVALSQFGITYAPIISDVLLPVGISFYTFQSMAYTIDVYRGTIPAEKHLGIFATFVAFFPQLVAGPIERASNMLPQFRQKFTFDYGRVVSGLRLMLWGAFSKVVIADRLAVYVNTVYGDIERYSGYILIIATVFFGAQIYLDFRGYSDIAIGAARVMGFDLMENFRQPYVSTSVREFWRRWHISLSTWFRDYLYFPLGGSRVPFWRNLMNILIVFSVSSLWHGATLTFLAYAVLHGIYVTFELVWMKIFNTFKRKPPRWQIIMQWAITMVLLTFARIFFRAENWADGAYVVRNMFNNTLASGIYGAEPFNSTWLPEGLQLRIALLMVVFVYVYDQLAERYPIAEWVSARPILRWVCYIGGILLIVLTLMDIGDVPQFIYYQF